MESANRKIIDNNTNYECNSDEDLSEEEMRAKYDKDKCDDCKKYHKHFTALMEH